MTKLTNQWQPVDFNLSHEPIQVLLHGESMKLCYNKTTFFFCSRQSIVLPLSYDITVVHFFGFHEFDGVTGISLCFGRLSKYKPYYSWSQGNHKWKKKIHSNNNFIYLLYKNNSQKYKSEKFLRNIYFVGLRVVFPCIITVKYKTIKSVPKVINIIRIQAF